MDSLVEIRAFVAVAEVLSFMRGGQRLNISPAQVSKLVARLEAQLGVRLLNRTTRQVSLTDAGRDYVTRVRPLLDAFDALQSTVRDVSGPRGLLKVSAPSAFGADEVEPAMLDFARACPDVSLEVNFSDRIVNLVEEGFDVAVRITRLRDSTLVARKIADVRMVSIAAPAYLEGHGTPQEPEDLQNHQAVIDLNSPAPMSWAYRRDDASVEVAINGRLRFSSGQACVGAAEAGFGIARLPAFFVAGALRAGRLRIVLDKFEPPPLAVYVVYPATKHLSAKVRAFVDFLVARFAGEPDWHKGWRA
jgi:DNA-binding transcriptional LysR family regulator